MHLCLSNEHKENVVVVDPLLVDEDRGSSLLTF